MSVEIKKEDKVKCQWCEGVYEAETWNDATLKECKSREMKRAFRPIYNKQVWSKTSQHFYKCPRCGMWSKGNQLILLDNEEKQVRGIGGQPIMRITNQ